MGKQFMTNSCTGSSDNNKNPDTVNFSFNKSSDTNQLDLFFNSIICGFVIIDPETHIIEKINEVASNMIGLCKSEIEGQICHTFICPAQKNHCPITDLGFVVDNSEKILLTSENKSIPILKKVSKQLIDGKLYLVESFVNISKQKLTEQKLKFLSYHDALTGLHNRRFFEEEIEAIAEKDYFPHSIIMGDVNGLKMANDAFGHFIGDQLLQEAASTLKEMGGESDIIARWGGDEFIMLLPNSSTSVAENLCQKIKANADKKYVGSVKLSISLGYATMQENDDINVTIKSAEDMMYRLKLLESTSHKAIMLKAIVSALHGKSVSEEQHSERVSQISKEIGTIMGFSEDETNELSLLGMLHDIGKIAINENILNNESKLTTDEWIEIKRHPEIGYRIIRSLSEMSKIADYILAHHEHYDGTGYPNGLKAEEIPLLSRIVAVADAYDAMTSDRPYSKAISKEEAIRELERNAGTQFDPNIVDIFCKKY